MRVTLAILSVVAIMLIGRGTLYSPQVVRADGGNILVNSSDDASDEVDITGNGKCELREAILAANTGAVVDACTGATNAHDVISFSIPGDGPHTIEIRNVLPSIVEPLTIDASTAEADTQCSTTIGRVLSVALAGDGIVGQGLSLEAGADGSIIRGLTLTGFSGVALDTSLAENVTIQCNHVGVDRLGMTGMGNSFGVTVGDGGLVGGTNGDVARNVISGNLIYGLGVFGDADVYNNYIGVAIDGSTSIGNDGAGIEVGAPGSNIGSVNHGNVISANGGDGIVVSAAATVIANYIGVDRDGLAIGNGGSGITVFKANELDPDFNVEIARNSINFNGGLGIDLGDDNIANPNDENDADTGPNGMLNHPVLELAGPLGFKADLSSLPTGNYRLDYYSSAACDVSGFGEGQRWDGLDQAIPGGTVHSTTTPIFGPAVTMTATNISTGATSEFSNCLVVTPDVDCDGEPTSLDALAVLRELAGLSFEGPVAVPPCRANVNFDETTDILDAWYIRDYIAGLVPF